MIEGNRDRFTGSCRECRAACILVCIIEGTLDAFRMPWAFVDLASQLTRHARNLLAYVCLPMTVYSYTCVTQASVQLFKCFLQVNSGRI